MSTVGVEAGEDGVLLAAVELSGRLDVLGDVMVLDGASVRLSTVSE